MTEVIKTETVQEGVQDTVQDVLPQQLGKTYEATAIEWLGGLYATLKDVPEAHHLFAEKHDENDNDVIEPSDSVTEGVIRFAHHLDSFQTLDMRLELLALRQMNKVDREFMSEMIDELGLEKAKEIALRVNARHNLGFNDALNATEKPVSA